MNNNLFVYFLIIHIIGDYYLQNDKTAEEKNRKVSKLLIHGLIYLIVSLICILPIWSDMMLFYTLFFAGMHLMIDILKYVIYITIDNKKFDKIGLYLNKQVENGSIYVIDQLLHIVSIYLITFHLFKINDPINISTMIQITTITSNQSLRFILTILLILKPVNITFRKLFSNIKPDDDEDDIDDRKMGKLIGNLERLLVIVLLLLNQFTAIGLVFTAKSISRYNKIATDRKFAEYYLLGTLFSMLSTLIIYLSVYIY